MAINKISIIDLLHNNEIKQSFIEKNKIKSYRITQFLEWILIHSIFDIDKMSNLDIISKKIFTENVELNTFKIISKLEEKETKTVKLLIETFDDLLIELVILEDDSRKTLCLSSQIGCPMGCKFCATGKVGFSRNLSSSEMLWEYLIAKKLFNEIDNIVIMGMGEPFLNFPNVKEFIYSLTQNKIKPFSPRRITISTSGVKDFSKMMLQLNPQIKLSISLHSPFDDIRKNLMPISLGIDQLIEECKYYKSKTKKRITFEYILIDSITDRKKDIEKLIKIAKQLSAFINFIPYNEVDGIEYKSSKNEKAIIKMLEDANIEYSLRYKRGQKIKGACGQLVWEKRKDR